MQEKLNVIVPFSRPIFFNNVIQNFKSQNYQNKRLIVVENGDGIGFFKDTGCIVLSSDCHHAHAKNEAISWLKKDGGGWWVTMDDDDYYGPEYLTEISNNLKNGNVLGKFGRFFGNEENTFLILGHENQIESMVLGATLTARAEESCELIPVTHDDLLFTNKMIELGGTVYATSKNNFIHKRYKNIQTSWNINVELMAQCMLDSGLKIIKWNYCPLDIVNGLSKISNYIELQNDFSIFVDYIKSDNSFIDFIKDNGGNPSESALKQLHNITSGRRSHGECSYQFV